MLHLLRCRSAHTTLQHVSPKIKTKRVYYNLPAVRAFIVHFLSAFLSSISLLAKLPWRRKPFTVFVIIRQDHVFFEKCPIQLNFIMTVDVGTILLQLQYWLLFVQTELATWLYLLLGLILWGPGAPRPPGAARRLRHTFILEWTTSLDTSGRYYEHSLRILSAINFTKWLRRCCASIMSITKCY